MEALFDEATALNPAERERFLSERCIGDEELRRELLAALGDLESGLTGVVKKAVSEAAGDLGNPAVIRSGELLKKRYRVERELGRGGLAVVLLARDEVLHGRPVVVKMLLERVRGDSWLAGKFAEELKALALIDHPGVVGPLDSGKARGGRPFLVMQYIGGRPLEGAIPQQGFPLARAADLLRQIGQALGAAHAKGVWHRDVKPANIMLQPLDDGSERVRLIDFGIATVMEAQSGKVGTRVVGTLPYMSPEQLDGRVGHTSDIWAMGVLAYELVTGRRPFGAENVIQLLAQQQAGPTIRPSQLHPGLPVPAENLILQALSFREQDRPQSARQFGEELAAALV
jgi:serine/threonine-protein kinase